MRFLNTVVSRRSARPWSRLLVVVALLLCVVQQIAATAVNRQPSGASAGASTVSMPPAVPAYRQANSVAILTVHGIIDATTLISLERRMKVARDSGADAVVIDLNTPGGEMNATLDICNLMRDRRVTPANVVAWINPQAFSAGTIIALACREIVVAPNATFGDAAPIQVTPFGGIQSLSDTERAKVLAPLLSEISESANRNHYDVGLVHSFVRLSDGLWMLEHVRTGERAFVGLDEYRAIFGADPPPSVAGQPIPTTGSAIMPTRSSVRPSFDAGIPRTTDTAGLTPQEAQRQEAFTQSLAQARPPMTAADRQDWRLVRQVIDDSSLLTLRANEAMYYGLASAVVANDIDIQDYFGAASVTRLDESWSERMVRFLISLPVRAILIIVFLISLFIELAAPGMGIFGTIAAVALLILIGAPALVGMAQWWEILLIIIGLVLILAELFLIPGTGLAGIGGVGCLLVGLVATFISGDISTAQGQTQLWTGLVTTLTAIFIAGVGMWLISRQLHSVPIINRLILHESLPARTASPVAASAGSVDHGALAAMATMHRAEQPQVGTEGMAETDLRPAGRAIIDGRIYDVQTSGEFVPRGAPVRVVATTGIVIEVEDASA